MGRIFRRLTVALLLAFSAYPGLTNGQDKAFGQDNSYGLGAFHALVIGNNEYSSLPKLKTAVADAEAVADVLTKKYGYQVQLLRNATRNDILRALNKYRADLTEDDSLLVYYAGHGWLDRTTETGYWQPVDAAADDDLNWIANEALSRRLLAMSARHVLVIADSCYSGTLVRSANSELPTGRERDTWLRRMAEKRSRTAIVSGGLEPVADSGKGGHSVFANAFLAALSANEDVLEGSALFEKISRPVAVNADQTPAYSDIRRANHEGGEFLFIPLNARKQAAAAPTATPAKPTAPDATSSKTLELAFWQAIEGSKRPDDFDAYLKQFPTGTFAPLAKSRLAALQEETSGPTDKIAGTWVSNVLINPYDKRDHYQLKLKFKSLGTKLVGSITRFSSADSPRKMRPTTRPLVDGQFESATLTFREQFEVYFGSDLQKHSRQYIGELQKDRLTIVINDTLNNPPVEFTATREAEK